jgi:hypothetical protein
VRASSLRSSWEFRNNSRLQIPPANSPALAHSQTPLVLARELRDFARLLDKMLRVAVDVKTSKISSTLNETSVGS